MEDETNTEDKPIQEIAIVIPVKRTSDTRIVDVGGKLCIGRRETKRELTAATRAGVDSALDSLFPAGE